MNWFLPNTHGEYVLQVAPNFLDRLGRRIHDGLFPMAPAHRNAYQVVSQSPDAIRFISTNILTGVNVGLNDVTVSLDPSRSRVRFEIQYWTWTKYCVVLCLTLFVLGLATLTLGRSIFPAAWFVEVDQHPVLSWGMLCFWGLAWPWIMVAIHKPHVRQCLINILGEVNELSDE